MHVRRPILATCSNGGFEEGFLTSGMTKMGAKAPSEPVHTKGRNGRGFGPTALASLHRLRRDGAGKPPQSSRATSGARNSRNTGDHLACSGPLEEWPRSLSSSK